MRTSTLPPALPVQEPGLRRNKMLCGSIAKRWPFPAGRPGRLAGANTGCLHVADHDAASSAAPISPVAVGQFGRFQGYLSRARSGSDETSSWQPPSPRARSHGSNPDGRRRRRLTCSSAILALNPNEKRPRGLVADRLANGVIRLASSLPTEAVPTSRSPISPMRQPAAENENGRLTSSQKCGVHLLNEQSIS